IWCRFGQRDPDGAGAAGDDQLTAPGEVTDGPADVAGVVAGRLIQVGVGVGAVCDGAADGVEEGRPDVRAAAGRAWRGAHTATPVAGVAGSGAGSGPGALDVGGGR